MTQIEQQFKDETEGGCGARAAVVHLNFGARSTFSVPVCTVLPGEWVNKADTQ